MEACYFEVRMRLEELAYRKKSGCTIILHKACITNGLHTLWVWITDLKFLNQTWTKKFIWILCQKDSSLQSSTILQEWRQVCFLWSQRYWITTYFQRQQLSTFNGCSLCIVILESLWPCHTSSAFGRTSPGSLCHSNRWITTEKKILLSLDTCL